MIFETSFFRSGELAELAGVSTDTLRHYERKGVLARPPRHANGYRQYPVNALRRVQLIRRALAVGFTLDELAAVLRVRDRGGAPCAEVRALAATKLAAVQIRLRELTDLRNDLKVILKDWDVRLEQRASGEPIHLLESLNNGDQRTRNHRGVSRGHLVKRKKEVFAMKAKLYFTAALGILAAFLMVKAQQQQKPSQPASPMPGMTEMQHQKMNERGDHVMGFDHTKTTHHFSLLAEGGSIEVAANLSTDTESREQIRMHLGHIAKMFGAGNFKAPMLIHDQIPEGVPTMQKLKSDIQYKFEETERGALIRISTNNAEALHAIHDFLRFQIKEHKTGDSLEVGPSNH